MDTTELPPLPPLTDDGFLPYPPTGAETLYFESGNPCEYGTDGAWLFLELRARFDNDYDGVFYLVQAWDHRHQTMPGQRWQFILLSQVVEDGWKVRVVHEWDDMPSFAEAGVVVDQHLTANHLRFMLR